MTDSSLDFSTFYDATWGRTVACAYGITGDLATAEDLAQEAYTRAWQRWSRIGAYDKPVAWVQRVATRLAISRWRRDRIARAFVARHRLIESTPGPDENSVALARALAMIPAAQRRAVVLHHLGGLSVGEIAELEKCPAGTIKARLSRGRAALAPLLHSAAESTIKGLEDNHV